MRVCPLTATARENLGTAPRPANRTPRSRFPSVAFMGTTPRRPSDENEREESLSPASVFRFDHALPWAARGSCGNGQIASQKIPATAVRAQGRRGGGQKGSMGLALGTPGSEPRRWDRPRRLAMLLEGVVGDVRRSVYQITKRALHFLPFAPGFWRRVRAARRGGIRPVHEKWSGVRSSSRTTVSDAQLSRPRRVWDGAPAGFQSAMMDMITVGRDFRHVRHLHRLQHQRTGSLAWTGVSCLRAVAGIGRHATECTRGDELATAVQNEGEKPRQVVTCPALKGKHGERVAPLGLSIAISPLEKVCLRERSMGGHGMR